MRLRLALAAIVATGLLVQPPVSSLGAPRQSDHLRALRYSAQTAPPREIAKPQSAYPHSGEPIGTIRQVYESALPPDLAVNTFRNTDRFFATRVIRRGTDVTALPRASSPLGAVRFTQDGRDYGLEDYVELNRVAALLVIKDGRVTEERYRFGNTERTRWMSMSVAKSMTSALVGAALKQGYIASLSDPITKYVPALRESAYEGVALRDVLMMSSGVRWTERYESPDSDRRKLLEAQISQTAGGAMAVMRALPRAAEPGTRNLYNTGETQVVAEVLRAAIKRPLADYLSERIWSRVGMEDDATWWLESPDGIEIGGSGISATLRDYGRFGLFMLNGGIARGESIFPDGWIAESTSAKTLKTGRTISYGYLWWTPPSGPSVQAHAYLGLGTYGQRLYVNPAAQVVVVVLSARPGMSSGEVISDWTFFDAVVAALGK